MSDSYLVVSDSATPWTVACQAPLSMEFSWQEYWIGLPFPFPGDRPNPGIKHLSPALQADSLPSESPRKSTTKRHSTPRGPSGIPLGQSQPLTSLSEEKAHQMKYIFLKSPLGVRNLTLKLFIFYRSIFQLLRGIGTILRAAEPFWTLRSIFAKSIPSMISLLRY